MPTEYSSTLMTQAEMRSHVETDLADADLQRVMDSEEEEMVKRFGDHAASDSSAASEVEKFYDAIGQTFVYLSREVTSVTTVVEKIVNKYGTSSTTLASNDYELWDNRRLRRLADGTNSRQSWQDVVEVTYEPYDDRARRRGLLIQLCKLSLIYDATSSTSVGEVSSSSLDYSSEREKLYGTLVGTGGFHIA